MEEIPYSNKKNLNKSLLLRTWELFESPHHRYDWFLSIPWHSNIDGAKMAKSTWFQRAKLQFPPPSADSLSTTVTRKFAKMPQLNSQMLSCLEKKWDFRLKTTSPHCLAQTKDQIIAHLLSVHVLARVFQNSCPTANSAREMWENACYTGLFTKDSAHTQKSLLLLRVCKGQQPGVRRKKKQKHIWGQHATVSQIRELPLLISTAFPNFSKKQVTKRYKKNWSRALK